MTGATMPRKRVSYRIDDAVIEAMKRRARLDGRNANNWLEHHLLNALKQSGDLPADYIPLGETRGGKPQADKQNEAPSS